jgi:glucan-binding YG repeat protein
VYTIEGNTSSGSEVIANGGAVCQKEYALTNSRIDGYGRPDWSLVEQPEYTPGWNKDNNGWWYADSKTTYHRSCWQIINGHKYYFNPDGYTVTGWQVIDNQDFYFEPRAGHPLECALYVSDHDGAQCIGEF